MVQVYDVVTDGGRPWIVMELLEARSLADMVIEDGPLAPRAVAKIGIAMLGALEVAHAAGVLHRDVKPANVLICADGRCVLTDFGVARLPTESKLTTPGMVLGSPHFISPERAVGGAFGPPSDLFSLGVTLYTAVEGGPPFDRGDPFETMRAVVEEAPRPARLAGPLQAGAVGLLDKEPARRWSVDQARAVLRELLAGPLSRSGHAHARTRHRPARACVRPPAGAAAGDPRPAGRRSAAGPCSTPTSRSPASSPACRDDHRHAGRAGRPDPAAPRQPARRPTRERLAPAAAAVRPATAARRRPAPDRPDEQAATAATGYGEAARPPPRAAPAGAGRSPAARSWPTRSRGRVRAIGRDASTRATGPGWSSAAGSSLVVLPASACCSSGGFSGGPAAPDAAAAARRPAATTAADPADRGTGVPRHRGIAVNVPKGWTRSRQQSYVDFTDPDGGRKVRINVETDHRHRAEVPHHGRDRPEEAVDLPHAVPAGRPDRRELAGHDGAELEYTCGSGDAMRHGIWRAIVVDGKAYHFYLTVPDARSPRARSSSTRWSARSSSC